MNSDIFKILEQIHAILIADKLTSPNDGSPDLQHEQLGDDTKTVASSGTMEDNVQGDKPTPGQSLHHSQENETYIGTVVKQEMPDQMEEQGSFGSDKMKILPAEERKSFITPEELLKADKDHIINVLGGLAKNDKQNVMEKVRPDKNKVHIEKGKRKDNSRQPREKMENVEKTQDLSKSEHTDAINNICPSNSNLIIHNRTHTGIKN